MGHRADTLREHARKHRVTLHSCSVHRLRTEQGRHIKGAPFTLTDLICVFLTTMWIDGREVSCFNKISILTFQQFQTDGTFFKSANKPLYGCVMAL